MDGAPNSWRFVSRSAQMLLLGAGVVTFLNATVSSLEGVNVAALRLTGIATIAASFLVPLLPWQHRTRLASIGVVATALIALVGTDQWHHYSKMPSSIAVYPVFFIVVISWAGLTQPRGTATAVALLSGGGLAWMLTSGGHEEAALQCILVTVPAAAILGEVVCWAHGRALMLSRLDAERRRSLEALVAGTSALHGAVTPEESFDLTLALGNEMFNGRDSRYERAAPGADQGSVEDDVQYESETSELRIRLRGQTGIVGTLSTVVDEPDPFMLDVARLFSQQIGTRLEQLRVIEALTDAATHDALTGISNRRAAGDCIATLQPGDGVFILDVDHFKNINDSLGHQAGDEVLTQLGDFLRDFTRPTDFVARYGGEEFLLICRRLRPDAAEHIANRLLDGWRMRRPIVTFSIGYTLHADGDPTEVTVEHADMALYQAKRDGRDRACRYAASEVTLPGA
jgi:diguanylate cyclase (GGDEF)-like protein